MATNLPDLLTHLPSGANSVFDLVSDAVFLIRNSDGRISDANKAACDNLGYARDELIGLPISAIDTPEFAKNVPQRLEDLRSKGHALFESSLKCKNGAPLDIEVNAKLVSIGDEQFILSICRDITSRNRALRQVDDSEKRLQAILDSTSECVKLVNHDGTLISMNPAGLRLVEAAFPNEVIGQNVYSIVAPEHREAFRNFNEQVCGGVSASLEFEIIGLKGTRRWMRTYATPFLKPDGETCQLAFTSDISNLKKTEEDQQLQLQILEQIRDAVITTDLEFMITHWNRGAERIFGYTPEEAMGRHISLIYPPGTPDSLQHQFIEPLLRQGWHETKTQVMKKTGEQFPVSLSLSLRRDKQNNIIGIIAYSSDISENERIASILREREYLLSESQRLANIGSWSWNIPSQTLTWTDESYHIFGVDKNSFDLTLESFLGLLHPEDRPSIQKWMESCQTGTPPPLTFRALRPDGTIRMLSGQGVMQYDAANMPCRIIGTVQDITAHKESEAAINRAVAETERASRAKSVFLASVSHDLRQPLSALSLMIDTLCANAQQGTSLLPNMRQCVDDMSKLLSNLLDLSKLDAGVVKPEASSFDVDEAVHNILASYTSAAEAKKIQLCSHLNGQIGHTDPILFQRIIRNLISNAVRYTQHGGVLVGYRRKHGRNWIEIWDTGIGIPSDKINHIFEEFYQVSNPGRIREKGSGLGLSIASKTSALLGLQLRVQSRPGKGSMFAVEIPAGKVLTPKIQYQYQHIPLKIALVEDNAFVADALQRAMDSLGHQVVYADSLEGLQSALDMEAEPDLVISDYRLAGSSTGYDVIAAVRKRFNKDIPGLIITGDTSPQLIKIMAASNIKVMYKPINLEQLRLNIANLMGLRVETNQPTA